MGEKPDLLEPVYWLQQIEDDADRLVAATELVDGMKELSRELAAQRRTAAYSGRELYRHPHPADTCPAQEYQLELRTTCNAGHSATEATQILAMRTGLSPQIISRLVTERMSYGG